jgi:hypothetical protein
VRHGALGNSFVCVCGSSTMFEKCYKRISLTSITPGLNTKELNTLRMRSLKAKSYHRFSESK